MLHSLTWVSFDASSLSSGPSRTITDSFQTSTSMVRFLGVRFALMGLVLLGVDVAAAMPSWSAFEGPPEIGVGAVLFFLTRPEGATPMKEIRTEIEIDAPAERAWRILTDFASFPQ